MRNAIDMALFVLNKYYRLSQNLPACIAAVLLDPSKRKEYLKKSWDREEMNEAIGQAQTIWETEYKDLPIPDESQYRPRSLHKNKKLSPLSAFDEIRAELTVISQSEDDFLPFINAAPVNLYDQTPLQWWCLEAHRIRYPRLHRMALDILSIPPMSDAPERTFSCGRRTIAWSRAKLKSESIQMVETLSNLVSQGFISPNQGMRELLEAVCDVDIDLDSADEED